MPILLTSAILSCSGRLYEEPLGNDASVPPRTLLQDLFVAEGTQPLILLMADLTDEQSVSELQKPHVYHGLFASETTFTKILGFWQRDALVAGWHESWYHNQHWWVL